MQINRLVVAAAAAVAVSAGGAGVAMASTGSGTNADNDTPITGVAAERASSAALAHLGEGAVTDTEVGDEEGYYEVEITLDDGSQVDVHLDERFAVIGTEADGPGTDG